MTTTVSTTAMTINLIIQVGQIGIFFGIFVYVYGSKISDAVHARKAKELKLANADAEYDMMINKGKEEYNTIISQATQLKQQILSEAEQLATQKSNEVLAVAQRR
jgi:F0F1-type ATP synthase membrane subunit b/b'